jgi:hypothetical protein
MAVSTTGARQRKKPQAIAATSPPITAVVRGWSTRDHDPRLEENTKHQSEEEATHATPFLTGDMKSDSGCEPPCDNDNPDPERGAHLC